MGNNFPIPTRFARKLQALVHGSFTPCIDSLLLNIHVNMERSSRFLQ